MYMTNIISKNTKNQYKHLTYEDRVIIQALSEVKNEKGKRIFNNSYIAQKVDVNRSTISRELKKRLKFKMYIRTGKCYAKPYNAADAQNDYKFKRSLSKGEYKLNKYKLMACFITEKIIKDKWALDVIVGFMKTHHMFNLSGFDYITTPTIYNAIRYGIINVKIEDTRRMKYKSDYEYKDKTALPISKIPYSIETRPNEVNKRLIFGHFELDTVIGSRIGKHECLLTITERKTRYEMIFKKSCKSTQNVVKKINQIKIFMKEGFDKVFKYFTADNGTEFSDFLGIISDTKTNIYFCHPYCSGEK